MAEVTNGMKSYTLSSEQIEALLASEYGGKLQPVDHIQLKRLRQVQQRQEDWKLALLAGRKGSKPARQEG